MIRFRHFCLMVVMCAFAKAYAIPQQSELKSSTEAEVIYNNLDAFLATVSNESLIAFDEYLSKTEVNTDDGKLAKVIALSNLGFYEQSFGQLHAAIEHYSEAWSIYNANKLRGFDILESCLKPLGNLYTQTNALEEARKTIEQFILLARKNKDKAAIADGLSNLSVVYHSEGNYAQAIKILENGISITPENSDLWMNLATNLYGIERYDDALNAVNKSLQLLPNQPNAFKLRSQIYLNNGRFKEATAAINRNITLLKTYRKFSPRNLAKSYLLLAEIQLVQATDGLVNLDIYPSHKAAEQSFAILIPGWKKDQELPETIQLYGENTLMDALDLKAEIYFASNKIDKGLHALELASTVSNLLEEEMMAQQSKLTLRTSIKQRTERYLENLYSIYIETQDEILFHKALYAIENAKNALVHNAYSESRQIEQQEKDTLSIDLKRLKTRQASLNSELFEARRKISENSARYRELLKEYQSVAYNLKKTREQWALRYPQLQSRGPVDLKSLQKKTARKEEVFISYFIGQSRSYSISVLGNTLRFEQIVSNPLEQEQFRNVIKTYVSFFSDASRINKNPREYAVVAHELYKLLEIPRNPSIIISPDSVLNFIPFAALTITPSGTMNYEQMPFLLYDSKVSYALSAKSYLEADESMSKNPSVMGVFPVFEDTDLELTYSVTEAEVLESNFKTKLLMREEAVAETAFAKANNHSILHFSTHATGGSLSTPASIKFYNSEVPVTRFYGETFHPELVVLSACETGVGKLVAGEGAQSLARGFQYAGARNILFTLWQVNDKSTAGLMSDYYKNLSKSASRNESLHNAQRAYLGDTNISNTQKSPYYWAPFVYYGTTEVTQEPTFWKWGVGSVIIVFLILLIYKNGITPRIFTRKRIHKS